MEKLLLLSLLVILISGNLFSQIIYVSEGSTGSGVSWENALSKLDHALAIAKNGNSIWVAKGEYTPSESKDGLISFVIPDGVSVYGGFKGDESFLNQREWKKNKTILSGKISNLDRKENCYNVIYTKNVSASTVVDGFIIRDGAANGNGSTGNRHKCGGGLYNDGSGYGNSSNPTIRNCIFENNFARDGAAVYNNGNGGESSPTFIHCKFINNRTDLDGGAVFNDGRRKGKSNPVFEDCLFEKNFAYYGGAVFNYGGAGDSSPIFKDCQFTKNEAIIKGGGIYNFDTEGQSKPFLQNCHFFDNISAMNNNIYNWEFEVTNDYNPDKLHRKGKGMKL